MESTSIALSIGAFIAGGWTAAFSKAGKDVSGLSRSMEELKSIGGKAFSFNDFNMKSENLKQAEKALDAFKKKLGDKTPTQQQERELNRLKKNVEDAGTKFDKAKDKVSEWKKSLHKNFVDVDRAMTLVKRNDALENLGRNLSAVRTHAGAAWGNLRALGLGLFAQASAVVAATASVSDWGDTMAKTAQRLNMFDAAGTENVERLQRMQWAALQANIENEAFTDALDKMNQVIGQAAMQGGETAKAFERLGLSAKSLSTLGADRQFELIVKKLEGVTSASERARIVQQIWGRGAVGMQNLVARGWKTIAADMDGATKYIVTDNRRIVDTCGAWDTAMKELRATWNSVFRGAVMEVMPKITETMKKLSVVIAENKGEIYALAQKISGVAIPVVSFLANNLDKLVVVGGMLGGVIAALKFYRLGKDVLSCASAAISATKSVAAFTQTLNLSALAQKAYAVALGIWKGITVAATAVQWAWNAAIAANPIGLIALALAGAAALIYAYWEPICGFFSEVWDGIARGIPAVWERISGFFSRIGDAVAAVAGTVKNAFAAAWKWISGSLWKVVESSPAYKLFSWAKDAVSAVFASTDAAPAETNRNPLSGTELETMSRAAVAGTAGARTDARTFNTTANISITQQPGEDADALARRVSARLADSYGDISAAAI